MTHEELITNFYEAFSKGDAKGITACYHKDILFKDPAFGELKGMEAKKMWELLLSRNKAIHITYNDVTSDKEIGSAKWIATYNYGPKNRKVVNTIKASFVFKEGKIIQHIDEFSMWNWSRQALGVSGLLLGWTPFLRNKVQKMTHKLLREYIKKTS